MVQIELGLRRGIVSGLAKWTYFDKNETAERTLFSVRRYWPLIRTAELVFMQLMRSIRATMALLGMACCVGCAPQSSVVDISHQAQVSTSDILGVTVDYLMGEQQFAIAEIEEKVSTGLSRWISADPATIADSTWTVDPMIETLPAEVKSLVNDLDTENFKTSDAHFLQGQVWFKALAETICARKIVRNFWPPLMDAANQATNTGDIDPFLTSIRAAHPEFDDEQTAKLLDACKLFDWTVRNVLLVERRDWPSSETIGTDQVVEADPAWPPSCGVAGPGYQRFNWQILLYGRGDDIERARVFAQLASQRGLDVVLLAFQTESDSSAPNEKLTIWLPALALGEHLVLFDTRLGMPLPTGDNGRFATLADIKSNPEILRALDLTVEESTSDDSDYWLRPETAAAPVVALIDAPLESLTKRMAILERNLTGNQRLTCSSRPTALAERLKSNSLIAEVRLLSSEFCVHQYRQALNQALQQIRFNADIADKLSWMFSEEEYVDNYVRFRTAKNKYFMNKLDSPPGIKQVGAKEMLSLMIVRYTDELINNLQENRNILIALGLQSENMSVLDYQRRLEAVKNQMRLVRGDANYFLALCHLESDNPSTALIWLDRVPALDNRNYWEHGTPYLEGRAHEMLDQVDLAIEKYNRGKDEPTLAPQAHGNLIRSRLLKRPRAAASN